jgi:hypothetical protein
MFTWPDFEAAMTHPMTRPCARMGRKWNNRDSTRIVACYGTSWCQLADRIPKPWLHICCTMASSKLPRTCMSANLPSKPRNKSASVTIMQNEVKTIRLLISRPRDYGGNAFVIFCPCVLNAYRSLSTVPTNAHIIVIYCMYLIWLLDVSAGRQQRAHNWIAYNSQQKISTYLRCYACECTDFVNIQPFSAERLINTACSEPFKN